MYRNYFFTNTFTHEKIVMLIRILRRISQTGWKILLILKNSIRAGYGYYWLYAFASIWAPPFFDNLSIHFIKFRIVKKIIIGSNY